MIFVRQARSQGACAKAGVAPAANAASATSPSIAFTLLLRIRLEPNDVAGPTRERIVRRDVDEAVRALTNVADAILAHQERLAVRHGRAVDREPHELLIVR